MKNLLNITTILIITLFAGAATVEAKESEMTIEKYEQAYESYIHNLSSDVDGVVITSMMYVVELVRNYQDEFSDDSLNRELSLKLREIAYDDYHSRLGYKAYLSLVALNHLEEVNGIQLNHEHPVVYFNELAESLNSAMVEEVDLTTELQEIDR